MANYNTYPAGSSGALFGFWASASATFPYLAPDSDYYLTRVTYLQDDGSYGDLPSATDSTGQITAGNALPHGSLVLLAQTLTITQTNQYASSGALLHINSRTTTLAPLAAVATDPVVVYGASGTGGVSLLPNPYTTTTTAAPSPITAPYVIVTTSTQAVYPGFGQNGNEWTCSSGTSLSFGLNGLYDKVYSTPAFGGFQIMAVFYKGDTGDFPAFDGSDTWYTTLTETSLVAGVTTVNTLAGSAVPYLHGGRARGDTDGGWPHPLYAPMPGYTLASQSSTKRVWAKGADRVTLELSVAADILSRVQSIAHYEFYTEAYGSGYGTWITIGDAMVGGYRKPNSSVAVVQAPQLVQISGGSLSTAGTQTITYQAGSFNMLVLRADGSWGIVNVAVPADNVGVTPDAGAGNILLGYGQPSTAFNNTTYFTHDAWSYGTILAFPA